MVRYHGVLAPRAASRRAIVPANPPVDANSGTQATDACAHSPKRWTAWATLMQRVFAVDVLECPRCGGKMKILATIHPPEATTAILESLGLSPRGTPARVVRRALQPPLGPCLSLVRRDADPAR